MTNNEAKTKFGLADKLFLEERYADALVVLDELAAAFPGTKNVLYPQALCLSKVGRFEEAQQLCDQLIAAFGDSRAEQLLKELTDRELATLSPFDATKLGSMFAVKPQAAQPTPRPEPKSSNRTLYIALGVAGAVIVLGGLAFLIWGGSGTGSGGTQSSVASTAPTDSVPQAISWYQTYEQGQSAARDSGRPTLAFYYSTTSDDCRKTESDAFAQPSNIQLLRDVVCVKVNFDTEKSACAEEKVTAVPTVVIYDKLGIEKFRRTGYMDARTLYDALLKQDLKPIQPLAFAPLIIALAIVLWVVWAATPLFFTLLMLNKLPSGILWRDLWTTSLVALGLDVFGFLARRFIPFFGGLISLIAFITTLRTMYDFGFLDFIVYLGMRLAVGALCVAILVSLAGTAFWGFLTQFATQ